MPYRARLADRAGPTYRLEVLDILSLVRNAFYARKITFPPIKRAQNIAAMGIPRKIGAGINDDFV